MQLVKSCTGTLFICCALPFRPSSVVFAPSLMLSISEPLLHLRPLLTQRHLQSQTWQPRKQQKKFRKRLMMMLLHATMQKLRQLIVTSSQH